MWSVYWMKEQEEGKVNEQMKMTITESDKKLLSYLAAFLIAMIFIMFVFRPLITKNTEVNRELSAAKVEVKKIFPHNLRHLFARTFYSPIGEILPPVDQYIEAPFASGFTDGYLTMDLLAALAVGGLAISAVKAKGITEQKAIYRTCIKACLVAIVLMGAVYTALAYLGATCPAVLGYSANGGIILSSATYVFFGDAGKLVLAFIIGFACLTTSIGVSAAFASYYQFVSDGRLGYKKLLLGATIFSYWAANMGLTELIRISVPFLVALYPIFIVLVILSLCDEILQKSALVYRLSIGMTLPFSILDGLQAAGISLPGIHDLLVAYLPLYTVNLGWLLPALIGGIAGLLWNMLHNSHQTA